MQAGRHVGTAAWEGYGHRRMSVDSQSATRLRLASLPSWGRVAMVAAGALLAVACVPIVVVVGGKVGLVFGVVLVS